MRFTFFILFAIASLSLAAQKPLPPGEYSSKNKKAIKYYQEGEKYFQMRKDSEAEKELEKAVKEDPLFIEAHMAYAQLQAGKNNLTLAEEHYHKAIEINPKFYSRVFFDYAMVLFLQAKYAEAQNNFQTYLKFERISPSTREEAEFYLKCATFAAEGVKKPKPFKPVNAGNGINSENNEYFPAISADGTQFMFTRALPIKELPGAFNEDFYISNLKNKLWQPAAPISNINSQGNEGAPTLSADGNIMFFASCSDQFGDYGSQDRKGYGSCDIFYSQKVNGKWTRPRNGGSNINTANWETQPSFSSDGKTLYFIRGTLSRGNIREQDIYMSTIGEDGKFSIPVKLPDHVNTPFKEESVFIHPDNQTLYFSSEGHVGFGGLDIYMSRREPDGSWGPAVNLGYPINTVKDENSILVGPDGAIAYFASNREGGFGGLDIYQFEIPEDIRPQKITYTKGKIFNDRTREPLEANFELIDLETSKTVTQSFSDASGQFFVVLTANKNYMVNVNRPGFLFYSDNFSLKGTVADFNKPFLLEIPLQPIDTGSTVELKNIFFDVNKWDLKSESKAELEKLISFLVNNPNLKIELGGHTDNSGDKKFNQTLSSNRAKAVYDYLITNGKINAARLAYKGYAETKPKVTNDTPENKARNRRTEIKIIALK
jgi:outer membrane protein OmpA-like peptidoglycan-associated protein/Tol biopolymer transport system component